MGDELSWLRLGVAAQVGCDRGMTHITITDLGPQALWAATLEREEGMRWG